MEVKVISREMIEPSSLTPSHLKHFKLSFLDQHVNLTYVPVVFHYPPTKETRDINQVLAKLKTSLAETLSIYYPLAGRFKDHMYIDCNDEGVIFSEARVNCDMSLFLERPNIDLLYDFVPSLADQFDKPVQVGVQVNVFVCGGISLGVCVAHRVIDAGTVQAFMKCWSAIASGRQDRAICPNLTLASSLFPPKELPLGGPIINKNWILKEGKSVLRRFVFDVKAISALKSEAASEDVPNPSRVQVVACFIWKSIIKASEKVKGFKQPSVLAVAINIRPYTTPPMSEYTIGNNFWWAVVHEYEDSGLQLMVSRLRKEVAKIDGKFVRNLQGGDGFSFRNKYIEEINEMHPGDCPNTILFSSVNGFKFTELDFGWGKPIWISQNRGSRQSSVFVDQVIMGETGSGDGIEAWVLLGEKEMKVLENDPDFLRFAFLNPSVPMQAHHL